MASSKEDISAKLLKTLQQLEKERCDFDHVQKINNVDINEANELGETMLHLAAYEGYALAFEKLLGVPNVNVNAKSKDGSTPLHYAVIANEIKLVELLIKNGAKIHEKHNESCSPFLIAVQQENISMAKLFIEKGDSTGLLKDLHTFAAMDNITQEIRNFTLKLRDYCYYWGITQDCVRNIDLIVKKCQRLIDNTEENIRKILEKWKFLKIMRRNESTSLLIEEKKTILFYMEKIGFLSKKFNAFNVSYHTLLQEKNITEHLNELASSKLVQKLKELNKIYSCMHKELYELSNEVKLKHVSFVEKEEFSVKPKAASVKSVEKLLTMELQQTTLQSILARKKSISDGNRPLPILPTLPPVRICSQSMPILPLQAPISMPSISLPPISVGQLNHKM